MNMIQSIIFLLSGSTMRYHLLKAATKLFHWTDYVHVVEYNLKVYLNESVLH